MKVDSTTNQFSYSSIMDGDDDLLTMAGGGFGLGGDDSSQHSGSRVERKSNKPIMEKRRRARINNCLNELKNILLEAMKKDPARHSKLEKADILELTVRHLQNIQRNQLAIAMATDPTVLHRFKNGFSECVTEVNRYMGRLDGAEPGVRTRLLDHLGNCVNGLQQVGPTPFGSTGPVSAAYPGAIVGAPPPASFPGATMPPATALGIHSAAAAIANLRHATSATHIPPSVATLPSQHPNFSADDLNNNFVRGPPGQPHPHDTSARLMSAFAVASTLPRALRPSSPPSSPPPSLTMSSPPSLNMSSSSHESSSTQSSLFQQSTPSSRNDSGLSDHSDLGSSSMSRSSSSSNRTSGGGTGDPIDFSIGKVLNSSSDIQETTPRSTTNPTSTPVRVVKVEPMPSIPTPSPDESSMPPNKDMWRPW